MNTLAIAAVLATVSVGAYAADSQMPDKMPHENFMENLTADQRSCIEQYGCQMPQMPEPGAALERPTDGARPTPPNSAPDSAPNDMDCMRQAMESCGVQMPTPPARPTDGAKMAE